MGKLALVRLDANCLFRARKSLAGSLILVVWLSLCLPGQADTSAESGNLSQIEQHLFFTSYEQEDILLRLNRLEKRVFGMVMSGSTQERLARLIKTAKPAEQPAVPSTGSAPPVVPGSPSDKPGTTDADEQAYAMERARVAVKAAKEEEITSLLADGVSLWRQKAGPEALEKFEQVVRLDPQNAEAHFSMGVIEEASGNMVEAACSYRLAAKARPQSTEYKEALAAIEKKVSSKSQTDSHQSELTRLAEDAVAAYRRGELISALDLYRTLDAKAPNQALIKYNIGTIFLVMKDPEQALEYYKLAHKLAPGDPKYQQAYEKLAQVVHQDKKKSKSESKHQSAPDNTQAASGMPTAQSYSPATASGMPMAQPYSPATAAGMPTAQSYSPAMAAGMPMATANSGMAASKMPAPPSDNQNYMINYGIMARPTAQGLQITSISPMSRATRAHLQPGDFIRAVEGTVVSQPGEVNQILSGKYSNQPVQLMIQRGKSMGQVSL